MRHCSRFAWIRPALIVLASAGAFAGCAAPDSRFGLWPASREAQGAADDAKCEGLGFKHGTDAFGNCRLQLEQIRATKRAADAAEWESIRARRRAQAAAVQPPLDPAVQPPVVGGGRKVYEASECIGPVIMGECKGPILPNKASHPTCHGEWLNGQCTGPMF